MGTLILFSMLASATWLSTGIFCMYAKRLVTKSCTKFQWNKYTVAELLLVVPFIFTIRLNFAKTCEDIARADKLLRRYQATKPPLNASTNLRHSHIAERVHTWCESQPTPVSIGKQRVLYNALIALLINDDIKVHFRDDCPLDTLKPSDRILIHIIRSKYTALPKHFFPVTSEGKRNIFDLEPPSERRILCVCMPVPLISIIAETPELVEFLDNLDCNPANSVTHIM